MAKFQLWSRDEYGQGSIINSSEDENELMEQGKKEVSDINVNNALTVDDKKRNWEAYFVEAESKSSKKIKMIYGGKDTHNSDIVYAVKGGEIKQSFLSDGNCSLKIYLGELDRQGWYASDARGREITSLDHQDLEGKIVYFVRKL
jgi:hypothetical protein